MNTPIYHQLYSRAIHTATYAMTVRGLTTNPDEVFTAAHLHTTIPDSGKTARITIPVYNKKGVESSKALHIQVYNRGNRSPIPFELNFYLN